MKARKGRANKTVARYPIRERIIVYNKCHHNVNVTADLSKHLVQQHGYGGDLKLKVSIIRVRIKVRGHGLGLEYRVRATRTGLAGGSEVRDCSFRRGAGVRVRGQMA